MKNQTKTHSYRIVARERQKFIIQNNKTFYLALQHQILPVIHHIRAAKTVKGLYKLISNEPIKQALEKAYFRVGRIFARAAYDGLKGIKGLKAIHFKDDDWDYDFQDEVSDYIGTVGAAMVTAISDTTEIRLNNFLKEAESEGWGIDKIASGITKHFDGINMNRARMIAITETNRASSWATIKGADMTGIDYIKSWIQTPEASKVPRDDHGDIDDVKKDEKFDVGGELADHPQDPDLSPEESCNCHCSLEIYRDKD